MSTIRLTVEEFETIVDGLHGTVAPLRWASDQVTTLDEMMPILDAGRGVLRAVEVMQAALTRDADS